MLVRNDVMDRARSDESNAQAVTPLRPAACASVIWAPGIRGGLISGGMLHPEDAEAAVRCG